MHMSRFHKEVIDSAYSPGRNRVPSAKVKPQKPFSYLLSVYFSWRVELLEHRLLANTSCPTCPGNTVFSGTYKAKKNLSGVPLNLAH